jgi:hypothetical protein
MSPQGKLLWLKSAIVGACIEGATWLLPVWASRASPAHPEDTIPMFVFGITQIPSVLLVFLLLPLMRLLGIPPDTTLSYVVTYAVTSIFQGFLFAALAYFLLCRPEKKSD